MPLDTRTTLLALLALGALATSSPIPSDHDTGSHKRILYDQRQEGDWNVRAELNSITFTIIPINTKGMMPSLLDLLRSAPKANLKGMKRLPHVTLEHGHLEETADVHESGSDPQETQETQETRHFIETKTAPYHVDIGESRSQLARLRLEGTGEEGEVVIASSPRLSLVGGRGARLLDPAKGGEFLALIRVEGSRKAGKGESKKKTIKEKGGKVGGKVLGVEGEEEKACAPGEVKDSYGACRTVQK